MMSAWIVARGVCTRAMIYAHQYRDPAPDLNRAHLWDDFKPNIDGDRGQASRDGLTDIALISVVEPECQESERVLKRSGRRERDGPQEPLDRRDDISREMIGRQTFVRDFQLGDDFKVGQCPGVPRSVPSRIQLRCHLVVVNQLRGVRLLLSARAAIMSAARTYNLLGLAQTRLPLTELDVTSCKEIRILPE